MTRAIENAFGSGGGEKKSDQAPKYIRDNIIFHLILTIEENDKTIFAK